VVFLASCFSLQIGVLQFSLLRHVTSWLLFGCFAALVISSLALLCYQTAHCIARIWHRERWFSRVFLVITLIVTAGAVTPFAYAPPDEAFFGFADQGVYLNSAVHLARTGSYRIDVPILRETPASLRPWMLANEPAEAQRHNGPAPQFWNYHTGFLLDPQPNRGSSVDNGFVSDIGKLDPVFPPGFPLVLAAAYQSAGWQALMLVNRVVIILAAVLLGLIANHWLPPKGVVGICVFLVAVFLPLNIWAGRTFYAEPTALCFWLVAVLMWAQSRLVGTVTSALIAGAALAAALYVKFDILLVGSLTILGIVLSGRSPFKWISLVTARVVSEFALIGWWQFSWPNFFGNITSLAQSRTIWVLAVAGVLAVIWLYRKRTRPRAASIASASRPLLHAIVAVSIVALAAYAYWFRRDVPQARVDHFFYWPIQSMLRSYREDTFYRLGWYWQPFGLWLAVMGVATISLSVRTGWQKTFFWAALIPLAMLSYDLRNNPLQPYAMRRLVLAALPLLVIGGVAFFPIATAIVMELLKRRKLVRERSHALIAATSGTMVLLSGFAPINSRLNTQPPRGNFAGLVEQISKIAHSLPSHSIVVIRRNSPLASLATPLQFLEGVDAILVDPASHSTTYQTAFVQALKEWTGRGHRVFFLTAVPNDQLDLFGAQFDSTGHGVLNFPVVSQSASTLNTEPVAVEWEYYVEQIRIP
jgi:hypothetical protein